MFLAQESWTSSIVWQVLPLPKYMSTASSRAIKTDMHAYMELANRYSGKSSSPELAALVSKHQAEFLAVRRSRSQGSQAVW